MRTRGCRRREDLRARWGGREGSEAGIRACSFLPVLGDCLLHAGHSSNNVLT